MELDSMQWMQTPIDQYSARIIKSKARRLSRRGGFTGCDRDDIEQELRLHLWRQASKFDPTITTWEKFVSFILDKRCISLLRERTAGKRNRCREECSLNDPVLDADARVVDRHQTTPEASKDLRWLLDLRSDLSVVRKHISDEAWQLVRGLADDTLATIAGENGWSANATRHLRELRRICEDLGLRDYL